MKIWQLGLGVLCTCGWAACGGSEEPPAVPEVAPAPPPPAPPPPPPEPSKPEETQSVGSISPDILRACGIESSEALFKFDSASVQRGDLPVLDKVAECFTSGPLKDARMRLVGRADPRGDEEYNMVLGGRRADKVRDYLADAGMPPQKADTTSRGEMDAMGTDPSGWARDRRVDIVLAD